MLKLFVVVKRWDVNIIHSSIRKLEVDWITMHGVTMSKKQLRNL
jgi:hypothetical protein